MAELDTKMVIKNGAFELPIDITENGVVNKTLKTADTYLDKNIKVTVTTPDAEFEVKDAGAVTATVSYAANPYVSDTETQYPVTIKANANVSDVTVGVKTAGFAAATDTVTVAGSAADEASKTVYVKEGSITATGAASATSANVALTQVVEQPENGFYIKASTAGTASVATAGWVDPAKTAAVNTNGDTYYTLKSASLNNAAAEGVEYTTINTPVLVSGSGLYIKEGYIDNTYISLADLVPDEANVVAGTSNKYIYKTVSVYDKNGALVAGSMDDATMTPIVAVGQATVGTVAVAAADDQTKFNITGSADITGTASAGIGSEGYATTSLTQTGDVTGTATVSASVAKIGLGAEASDDDIQVTPVVVKHDSTNAKTGAITTTQPTSGRFVAVNTNAIAASATVTPTVASAGYGTEAVHSATATTVTAGAAASGTYYVPVTAGSHAITDGNSTVKNVTGTLHSVITPTAGATVNPLAGFHNTAPATGEYITITPGHQLQKGRVAHTAICTSTEGYVEAGYLTKSYDDEVNVIIERAIPTYIKIYDGSIL